MVGAVTLRPPFTDEISFSLYQKNFFQERRPCPIQEIPLIPEIVEEREITFDQESFGYDRLGKMKRINPKGIFVDSYH